MLSMSLLIVTERDVLQPRNEGRDLLDVVAAIEQEDEHDDGGEGGSLIDVHEDGVEGEVLGDKDIEEVDEDGGGGFEATHPVGDNDEKGGEDELHRQVTSDASEVVGGELIHAGGVFFEQHRTFLGEGEDGVEEREEAL
ncbi:hypothetical protein U1Q18_044389 [Sarracenia purpurea var. burkii]